MRTDLNGDAGLTAAVAAAAGAAPDRPAIEGVDHAAWSYRDLLGITARLGADLAGAGLRPGDRVAIVLPPGLPTAAVLLAVAAVASAAPYNPELRQGELESYFADGRVRLVLTDHRCHAAVAAAAATGLPVAFLDDGASERPTLDIAALPDAPGGPSGAADEALVLHTSGTTSRPKPVPLTHANLIASAENVAGTLALTPNDRSLTVMPLFHIHGIVAGLLAPLLSGGTSVVVPGFAADRFGPQFAAADPTWYSAVPAIHQAILDAGPEVPGHRLRFIRSSSSALPEPVRTRLERVFGVPVLEAYGMTEAAHQIASNRLPPADRKPGSVGRPAGPEVAVLDPTGHPLPPGATGEVAVRGANVTAGYDAPAEVNAAAFANGWLRTGDEGRFDADGDLFLTGRLKEMINRGGEKITPREIEDVLLTHPDVAQAAVFAAPHPHLGEDVAAALVPAAGRTIDIAHVRLSVRELLAHFKVPRRIVVLDDLPKSATGKVQRSNLAALLGVAFDGDTGRPPATPMEERLAHLLGTVLGDEVTDAEADFIALGADSLQLTRFAAAVMDEYHEEFGVGELFATGTVAGLAAAVLQRRLGDRDLDELLSELEGDRGSRADGGSS